MKINFRKWFSFLVSVFYLVSGKAAEVTLNVGDPPPKMQVLKWVQGDPVTSFEKGKAYIVEFWATWCGPCRVSIPHLNEIHTKFKDKGLVVIGQDVWEQNHGLVAPFVKKMGDKMTYRVALDTAEEKGKMAETWMEASGQGGIPTAFVIEKSGLLAWIGHPMELKETLLEQVLNGTFDVKKAALASRERRQNEEKLGAMWRELRQQMSKEAWDQAETKLAQIEQALPEDEKDRVGMPRFQILLGRKDFAGAYKVAAQLSERTEDPMLQNELAWQIATREGIESRDLNLAEKIARRGNETTKGENAEILDTLARVLFLKGQSGPAIDFEEKAVKFAEGRRKMQFEKNLQTYRAGKVPDEQLPGRLRREFDAQIRAQQWEKAEGTLAQLEQASLPIDLSSVAAMRFEMLLDRKDYRAAYKLAASISETCRDDAAILNTLAWAIASKDGLIERDLELGEKIARRAVAAPNGEDGAIIDTLARILFMRGQKDAAIDTQAKAVDLSRGARQKEFQKTLDSYKKGILPALN